jgi:hypothetical protein
MELDLRPSTQLFDDAMIDARLFITGAQARSISGTSAGWAMSAKWKVPVAGRDEPVNRLAGQCDAARRRATFQSIAVADTGVGIARSKPGVRGVS